MSDLNQNEVENRRYRIALIRGGGAAFAVALLIWAGHWYTWQWQLDKGQNLFWELVLKAVAGYVSVLGLVITAFKYIDEKARQHDLDIAADIEKKEQELKAEFRQREQQMREDRKEFLREKQDVYKRLGMSLADIMNHDPPVDPNDQKDPEVVLWPQMKETYFKIYWGEIRLVADSKVMVPVEAFSKALHTVKTSKQKEALSDQVIAISNACRDSLGEAWKDIRRDEKASADGIFAPTVDGSPDSAAKSRLPPNDTQNSSRTPPPTENPESL